MKTILNKITCTMLAVAVVLASMVVPVMASSTYAFSGGTGIETDPYLISTSADLVSLAAATNTFTENSYHSAYYKLTADIDMTGVEFDGISEREDLVKGLAEGKITQAGVLPSEGMRPYGTNFSGTIDGNNHVIRNLTVDRSDNPWTANGGTGAALICWSSGATIKNLGLENCTSNAVSYAAGFVGRDSGGLTITNCYVKNLSLTSDTTNADYRGAAFVGEPAATTTINGGYAIGINSSKTYFAGFGQTSRGTTVPGVITNFYTDAEKITKSGCTTETNTVANIDQAAAEAITTLISSSSGAFKVDTYIQNDGYPLLAWETYQEPPTTNDIFANGQGIGTQSNPYQISTANDLVILAEKTNKQTANSFHSAYYKIVNDIDMTGVEFDGISEREDLAHGYSQGSITEEGVLPSEGMRPWGANFSGTIDGDYHVIRNMTVDRSDNPWTANGGTGAALICWTANATIKNLGLENCTSNAVSYAAGFIGRDSGGGSTITNCYIRNITLESASTKSAFVGEVGTGTTITNGYAIGLSGGTGAANSANGAVITNFYTDVPNVSGAGSTNTNTLANIDEADASAINTLINSSGGAFYPDLTNVNSGYPVLKWEREKVSETGTFCVSALETTGDGNASFSIKNCNTQTKSGAVVIVTYGADREMLGADVFEITSLGSGEFFEQDATTVSSGAIRAVKVIVWDSLANQNICDSMELTFPQS